MEHNDLFGLTYYTAVRQVLFDEENFAALRIFRLCYVFCMLRARYRS